MRRTAFIPIVSLAYLFGAGADLAAELRHRWIFDPHQTEGKSVTALSGQTGTLHAEPAFDTAGVLLFDGAQGFLGDRKDAAAFWLPEKSFSAEAWVKVDETVQWGGIVGYQQDNGSYEKGWVLGYSGNHFFFKVSNGPRLHTATAASPLKAGKWHHVVGTYDGITMRLFVDGALEASTTACSGDIEYPPEAPFAIGVYHDKDEFFPLKGQIREVRLYDNILAPDAIAAHLTWARDLPDKSLQLTVPPGLLYTSASSAVVDFESEESGTGAVEITSPDGTAITVSGKPLQVRHRIELANLLPRTEYQIRPGVFSDDETLWGPPFTVDTTFNFSPPALTNPPKVEIPAFDLAHAKLALASLGDPPADGFCLVLGPGDGRLAEAIARAGNLRVIALCDDPSTTTILRRQAYEEGIYGERLTYSHVGSFGDLPYTGGVADLIVAGTVLPSQPIADEIARLLAPSGGTAYLLDPDWRPLFGKQLLVKKSTGAIVATRHPDPGAGRWTHQYGDAGNSAFAGEQLGGVSSTDELEVQWIGRPGADFGIDRNPRMPAPLAVNGRLFHQGMNRIIALDAHHGTALWTREIPDFRRVNIPRDAANWCADESRLFLAVKDRAWILESGTGRLAATVPLPGDASGAYEWGYIANDDKHIFGTAVAAGSSYRAFWTKANWFDQMSEESTAKVCSESLFAYSKSDLQLRWERSEGIVINTSITLHDGRLYFAESRNPELRATGSGRISDNALWNNLHLVCLDVNTGSTLWEHPLDVTGGQVVFFLQASGEKLLLTTSAQSERGRGEYRLQTFAPNNGQPAWVQNLPWRESHHGAHMQHPVIVGGKIYVEPHGVDLETGEIFTTKLRPREGCSTAMASANAVFLRGTRRCLTVWSPETESPTHWPRLRPSCWLNMVAAQGLLLVPEGGAGCSCGGWMESSMAFRPNGKTSSSPPPTAPSPPLKDIQK